MNSQSHRQRSPRRYFPTQDKIVYAHDLAGNITFLNQTGEKISGYSREEMCRMNIAELVPAEIAAHVRDQIVHSVTRRVGTVYEIDLIAKDGHPVPLEVSTALVLCDGQPVEIEGIAVPSVIRREPRQ